MNKNVAIKVGNDLAALHDKPFVIYRLPAWPSGIMGVLPKDRGLPPEAEVIQECKPPETGLLF